MIDRVLLDLDGVLVNMVDGVFKHFGWSYPTSLTDSSVRTERVSYYIHEITGRDRSEIWPKLGREFWAGLEPLPWAMDVVRALENRFGKEHICLLTRPVETDGCVDGKRDWIKRYLPDYRWRALIGSAKEFCASPRRILIDDHEENCKEFREEGGHTFLFPAPWNRRFQEDAWGSVEEWIRALEILDKSRL